MKENADYYGIVIKESINNENLLKKLKNIAIDIYPHKLYNRTDVTIYKIKISSDDLDAISLEISESLLTNGFYAHIVKKNELVIIYPSKIFIFSIHQTEVINECIKYGESIGIEKKMMSFKTMFYRDHPNEKNAIVFGGSGDLGMAFSELLLEEGYNVYSTFCNNEIKKCNLIQLFFDAQVCNKEFYNNINRVDWDCMVFCIGVRSTKQSIVDTDYDEYKKLLKINAISFLEIYKKLVINFRQNHTKILVVSSSASLENKITNSAYSASKAYLDSIVKTLSKEERKYGVDIRLINPCLFDSKLAREIVQLKGFNDFNYYVDKYLDGKIKTVQDIVNENRSFLRR